MRTGSPVGALLLSAPNGTAFGLYVSSKQRMLTTNVCLLLTYKPKAVPLGADTAKLRLGEGRGQHLDVRDLVRKWTSFRPKIH